MSQESPVIVLTGGGSGGHITPILSLAHELKQLSPNCQIIYVGHKGDQFDNLELSSKDFDFVSFINGGKFRRYHGEGFLSHFNPQTFLLNVRDFFRVIGSIFASLRILRKVRPDVMFSKGGFVAVPVGIAARILRIPIVTHDSDAIPGLANRILGRWAAIRTTGMPSSGSGAQYVGIPINSAIKLVTPNLQSQLKKELGFTANNQILLVGGAGNGAKQINDLALKIAPSLLISNPGLIIVHIAGRIHKESVSSEYRAILPNDKLENVKVIGFTGDFYKYSTAADLIISRAGATSLAEFAAEGKACVIIPNPVLAGGHQLKNAEILSKKDAAVVVDNNIEPDELLGIVGELLNNPKRRSELAANLHKQSATNASVKLASIILKVAGRR